MDNSHLRTANQLHRYTLVPGAFYMGAVASVFDFGRSLNRFVCINKFNILNDVRPLHVLKGKMHTFPVSGECRRCGQGRGTPERPNATKLKSAKGECRHEKKHVDTMCSSQQRQRLQTSNRYEWNSDEWINVIYRLLSFDRYFFLNDGSAQMGLGISCLLQEWLASYWRALPPKQLLHWKLIFQSPL